MEKEKNSILKNSQSGQIDYYLLLKVLQGNLIKILIIAILIGGFTGLVRYASTSPYYTAEVKFLINTVTVTENPLTGEIIVKNNANDVGGAANIAYSMPTLIREDRALGGILDDLIEHDEYYKSFSRLNIKAMLNVTVDGQIITVYVTSGNKDIVLDVSEAVERAVPVTMDYYYGIANTEGMENISSVAKAITSVSEANIIYTGRNVSLFAFLGFVIGAVVIYLLALLRAYFDNTVYTEEDLKSRFTIPVIGQIPTWDNYKAGDKAFKDKSRKDKYKKADDKNPDSGNLMSDRDYDGRILSKKTPFAIAEAFKHLRTNMCYTTKGQDCAVYGLTSAYVSAGKSMIIANIAVSYAQMNKRVLLVDGDLRCPVQHRIFKLDNKVNGMSELLAGVCTMDNVYLRSGGYENLDIITSGRIPPNPAELLASENMRDFIERARTRYDVILIDLPPICEVSDAGIIAELVTGYVFVVRAGYSDRRMIEIAADTMTNLGASLIGFILNDIDIKSGDYYKNKYYSGYSKYRFRGGKHGYYRHFKYGYYRNGYGRGRYGMGAYGGYGGYGTSYAQAFSEAADEEETPVEVAAETPAPVVKVDDMEYVEILAPSDGSAEESILPESTVNGTDGISASENADGEQNEIIEIRPESVGISGDVIWENPTDTYETPATVDTDEVLVQLTAEETADADSARKAKQFDDDSNLVAETEAAPRAAENIDGDIIGFADDAAEDLSADTAHGRDSGLILDGVIEEPVQASKAGKDSEEDGGSAFRFEFEMDDTALDIEYETPTDTDGE